MVSLLNDFSFILDVPGEDARTLTPTNDRLQVSWDKIGGEYSRARRKVIKTSLTFLKSDYQFFKDRFDAQPFEELELNIYRKCGAASNVPTLWHSCRILLSKARWDHAVGRVDFDLQPNDLWKCWEQNKNKTVNILGQGTAVTVYSIYGDVSYRTHNFIDPIPGHPTDAEQDAAVPGGANAMQWVKVSYKYWKVGGIPRVTVKWAREVWAGVGAPPDNSWVQITDPLLGIIFARKPAVNGPNYHNLDNGLYEFTWDIIDFATQQGIDNGRKVKEVTPLIIAATGCDFDQVKSGFFEINQENPQDNAPYLRAYAKLKNLLIFQRSDILKAFATANASRHDITIINYVELLCKTFNCFYTIQYEATELIFRIEHFSYFVENDGLDVSASPYLRRYARFEIDSVEDIPPYEEFLMTKGRDGTIFAPSKMEYSLPVASSEPKPNPVPECTTDFEGLFLADDDDENDLKGSFLMAVYEIDSLFYIDREYNSINGSLSWWELLRKYWNYGRYMSGAVVRSGPNVETITINSPRRIKEAPEISFPISCDVEAAFNPDILVTTPLGQGQVDTAVYDTLTETLTLKLIYE